MRKEGFLFQRNIGAFSKEKQNLANLEEQKLSIKKSTSKVVQPEKLISDVDIINILEGNDKLKKEKSEPIIAEQLVSGKILNDKANSESRIIDQKPFYKHSSTYQKKSHAVVVMNPCKTDILSEISNKYKSQIIFFKIYESNCNVYIVKIDKCPRYAIKIIKSRDNFLFKLDKISREYFIHRTASQMIPHVPKIYDMKQIALKNAVQVEILLEYGGKSLLEAINKLSYEDLFHIVPQIINTLVSFEKLGLAHCDIKPGNILYNPATKQIMLTDFGAAMSFYSSPHSIYKTCENWPERLTGLTVLYAPPEMLRFAYGSKEMKADKASKIIPQKVDVFCFGITYADLLCSVHKIQSFSERPYTLEGHKETLKEILNKLKIIKCEIWTDIILSCLSYDPKKRPSFSEIKSLFIKVYEYLGKSTQAFEENIKIDHLAAGKQYTDLGEYESAVWHFNCYIKENEQLNNLENIAHAQIYLGKAYNCLEDYENSILCLLKAISVYKKYEDINYISDLNRYFEEILELADAYSYLGDAYNFVESLQNAFALHKKALNLYEKINGIANCVSDIAGSYLKIGADMEKSLNPSGAIKYYEKALSCLRQVEKNDTRDTAIFYLYLGTAHAKLNNYEISIDFLTKAGNILKSIGGNRQRNLIEIYSALAKLYIEQLQYDLALEYFKEALIISKKHFGEDNPKTATLYCFLGELSQLETKNSDAEFYYKTSIKLFEYYPNHPNLAVAYSKLAILYFQQSKLESFKSNFIKSETLFNKLCKNGHPELAAAYEKLGFIHEQNKDYEKSKKFYESAKQEYARLYGAGNNLSKKLVVKLQNIGYFIEKIIKRVKKFLLNVNFHTII